LAKKTTDILPRYPVITHDYFGNRVVQEFIDRWFIPGYQQPTRERRLSALTAHEKPSLLIARYIGCAEPLLVGCHGQGDESDNLN
jgi:hypothetical protein